MEKKPAHIIYGLSERPPLVKLLLLGLQYTTLIAVYLFITILIVREASTSYKIEISAVSMAMIALAISMMLQALWKGPIGSGYLAAPVVSAIFLGPSLLAANVGGLGAVFGMTIFAGIVEVILSQLLTRLGEIFPPGLSGLIVAIVGFDLGAAGMERAIGIKYPSLPTSHIFLVTLVTLGTMVALSIWARGLLRLTCSLLGIIAGFLVAYFLNMVPDTAFIPFKEAAFFSLPSLDYISYRFDPSLIIPFFIAGIAASLRTVGVIITCQKINDRDWKQPEQESIKKGVLADGIGSLVAGLLGSSGLSTAPSLVGVSEASGATSRYIAFTAGAMLIFFAMIPKLIAVFLLVPHYIIGAALVFTSSFMIAGGIQIMTSINIDTRMNYVIGFALLAGLSHLIYPDFYRSLPKTVQLFTSTTLSLTATVGIVLNLLFQLGFKKTKKIKFKDKDRKLNSEELSRIMFKKARFWRVDNVILDRCVTATVTALKHLQEVNLIKGETEIALNYDASLLTSTICYVGDSLALPGILQCKSDYLEEESSSYGIAAYLTGVFPDSFEQYKKMNKLYICMSFKS